MQIKVTYTAKWRLKDKPHYQWTECKKLINCRTGKEIKKTLKGMVAGYWISKEFISLNKLSGQIELVPKIEQGLPSWVK
jgi:hypothetical protein